MATAADGKGAAPFRNYEQLLEILQPVNLDTAYRQFMDLTSAPEDLKCLLTVASNLHRTFEALPVWGQIQPLAGWPKLMSHVFAEAAIIEQQFGAIVNPAVPRDDQSRVRWVAKNFRGELEERPLYAMLCCQHVDPERRASYGALQLQMLYARWAETEAARKAEAKPIPRTTRRGKLTHSTRIARMPERYARAVRDLSGPHFSRLLDYLRPEEPPESFVAKRDLAEFPAGRDYADRYRRIMNYCRRHGGARQGTSHPGASGGPRQSPYPEYVGYTDFRFGIKLESGDGEAGKGSVEQQTILERSVSESEALALGLDPQELGSGQVEILSEVPGAASPEEALQTARARTRSWEIDKSLFGWNAQALRIAELEPSLFPALRHACDDPGVTTETLTAAAVVAAAIDTGRDLDRILSLRVEHLPASNFSFVPPTKQDPNGSWSWHTIGPVYKSELHVPVERSECRADQLRFRATPLVRDLLLKHMKRNRLRSGVIFRSDKTGDWVESWIREIDRDQRITLNRLSHLRWNELHRITSGERAIACLTLGVPRTSAAVELHYAVLGAQEATQLFEQSGQRIWGDGCASGTAPASAPDLDAYSGCRGFPTRVAVKETVRWLRNGSRHFFSIPPDKFSLRRDRPYLNRAVLYLIWHQFFAFGTRAIRDAYQEKDVFAEGSGIGILSDKDFQDGYKTRIIWADHRLLSHMAAVEKRLILIARKLRIVSALPKSAVWFLDQEEKPILITPSRISHVFGERFPFPVNTPRKVMRNLLRERGVSHEHAEAWMGHWQYGREPWSPYSSFDFGAFIDTIQAAIPSCLREFGFSWIPGMDLA